MPTMIFHNFSVETNNILYIEAPDFDSFFPTSSTLFIKEGVIFNAEYFLRHIVYTKNKYNILKDNRDNNNTED